MSSSSLYGYNGNVTVSANNLTTLYNAQPGNVVVANVADRNFTTLYTNQTSIAPTKAYGNANVEAFLNAGTDGANIVQNIRMSGDLYVGDQSYLGNAGNVHIEGGQLNYVLATDGGGGLSWIAQSGFDTNIVPYIHFDVTTDGNNQQFTDALIDSYAGNTDMNVMKNGVNIEPALFEKVGNTTVQINIPLTSGDTIDILATGAGGGEPAGNVYEVQYNGSGAFAANSSFTFYQATSLLTVGNIVTGNANISGNLIFDSTIGNTGNIANLDTVNSNISNLNVLTSAVLGDVGNVSIGGGSNGQYLSTDGSGVLSWANVASGTPTSLNANIANVIINGGSNSQVLTTYGNGVLRWATVSSNGGTATDLSANIANVHIYDGANGQILSTDGTGNLSWITNTSLLGLTDANVVALGNNSANTANGGAVIVGNDAFASGSGGVAIGKNANAIQGVSVGQYAVSGGGGITVGTYAGNSSGGYNIIMGQASGTATGGAFNIVIGVDTTSGLSGNNNILVGREAAPSSSSVDGEITLGGSYTTNTRIPYGNLTVTGNINGTLATAAQPNITSLGNLTSLTVTGTTTIQQAKEKVTTSGTGSTGTINYDILTQAILFKSANATANFTLNIRGNSSTTFDTFSSTDQSTTLTYVNKNGVTGYVISAFQIDGVSQTLLWADGTIPTSGTTNGYDVYNFNIIKTGANTYAVFSTIGGYK